jgi:hypothetical protein
VESCVPGQSAFFTGNRVQARSFGELLRKIPIFIEAAGSNPSNRAIGKKIDNVFSRNVKPS